MVSDDYQLAVALLLWILVSLIYLTCAATCETCKATRKVSHDEQQQPQ